MNTKALTALFIGFFSAVVSADLLEIISPFDLNQEEAAIIAEYPSKKGWGAMYANYYGTMAAITIQFAVKHGKVNIIIPCLGFWFATEVIKSLEKIPDIFFPQRWVF
jgi:hypothetical protein